MRDFAIRPLRDLSDALAFRTLNEEWIERHFTLEARDREMLADPEASILRKGGRIFIAEHEGSACGCAALLPAKNGVYELSKMAVSPLLRGQGIGRKLLAHVIEEARAMGAKSLFLGSSTKLPNAIYLYEAAGFQHVPPDRIPQLPYTRANVFMELSL